MHYGSSGYIKWIISVYKSCISVTAHINQLFLHVVSLGPSRIWLLGQTKSGKEARKPRIHVSMCKSWPDMKPLNCAALCMNLSPNNALDGRSISTYFSAWIYCRYFSIRKTHTHIDRQLQHQDEERCIYDFYSIHYLHRGKEVSWNIH